MVGKSVRLRLIFGMAVFGVHVPMSVAQSVAVGVRSESVKRATVSVDIVNAPLADVLTAIARQAGLKATWDDVLIHASSRISLRIRDVPVDIAFANALSGTGLAAVMVSDHVGIVKAVAATPVVKGGIVGRIIDAKTHQGVRGATITLSGFRTETTSGDNGSFRIADVAPGSYTVSVRMLGYLKAIQSVTILDGQSVSIEVALHASVNALAQVVVTGSVVATERRAIPNAMTVITAQDLEQRGITKIDQLFRGDVPGLFVPNQGSAGTSGSGNPLNQVLMFSRGATSFGSEATQYAVTNPIKTYVDGVELADPSYLSQIDPKSIERIEILTGPQASTIYGSNAINGVMQIFTKRGEAARPKFTLTGLSGVIQNDYTTALAPQHDYSGTVDGTEGRISYNVGGSWNYVGAWTPDKQTTRASGFGGMRMQAGTFTIDGNFRRGLTQNIQHGSANQGFNTLRGSGGAIPLPTAGVTAPTTATLDGQTVGLTLSYSPWGWWSNDVVFGTDASDAVISKKVPGYTYLYDWAADTLLSFSNNRTTRTSLRYTTTVQASLPGSSRATISAGADAWHALSASMTGTPATLSGSVSGINDVTRLPSHNTGAFLQGQLGVRDAVFVTYGIRTEWNPWYGDAANPNVSSRYGIAYTQTVGPVTAKLRWSYGRSTRPPGIAEKRGQQQIDDVYWPTYDFVLANDDLGPESQQGSEGGIELYVGNRGSLVLTSYNQTVDNLIQRVQVDSVDILPVWVPRYGHLFDPQFQSQNVGSIRNQGWEAQGSAVAGPFMIKGTYSWTKSRMLGITAKYRAQFADYAFYQRGYSFEQMSEHTWAIGVTYAHAETMLSLNVNGTGPVYNIGDTLALSTSSGIRLDASRPRMDLPLGYRSKGPGYAIADLNGSHRLSSHLEAIVQVQNLTNYYQNDYGAGFAAIGRQTQAGFRVRL